MELTVRQQQTLDFISTYINQKGHSPTVIEIGLAAGISQAGANYLVKELIKNGYISTIKNKWRSISIVPEEFRTPAIPKVKKVIGELTKGVAHQIFEYRDGELFWKINRGNIAAGTKAGVINRRGYLQVMVQKKNYLGHRVIFLMHHGYMPPEIDHIDGNPSNNRIENLREATHEQNIANIGLRKTNTSGAKNVIYREKKKRWEVSLCFNGERFYGGQFRDFSSAQTAAAELRDKVHKEFANHGI